MLTWWRPALNTYPPDSLSKEYGGSKKAGYPAPDGQVARHAKGGSYDTVFVQLVPTPAEATSNFYLSIIVLYYQVGFNDPIPGLSRQFTSEN